MAPATPSQYASSRVNLHSGILQQHYRRLHVVGLEGGGVPHDIFIRPVPPLYSKHPSDNLIAEPFSDRSRRITAYDGVRLDVLSHEAPGSDDRAMTYLYTGHNRYVPPDPNVRPNLDRQILGDICDERKLIEDAALKVIDLAEYSPPAGWLDEAAPAG